MEDVFKEIENVSRKVAKRYLYSNMHIDDVVQQTMIQFYLNKEKVILDNLVNWVYTVSKNLCIDYHKLDKKNIKLSTDIKHNTLQSNIPLKTPDKDFKDKKSILNKIDHYSFLNATDKKILKQYIPRHKTLTALSKSFKIKKSVLKNRIYYALREIKFYELLQTDIIDFNTIPGTKIHANIKNFLCTLKLSLINNNLSELKIYLRHCKINEGVDTIKVKEIDSYKIRVLGEDKYKLIVAYLDKNNDYNFFGMTFLIRRKKNIQITEFPIFPKRVIFLNPEYAEGKSGAKALANSKGTYNGRLGRFDRHVDPKIGKEHKNYTS